MAPWWKRSRPVESFVQETPSLDDAADEGLAMALSAASMGIKNRILVSAITTNDTFVHDDFREDADEILGQLAKESLDGAALAKRERAVAEKLRGRPAHQHDYRQVDVDKLTLRIAAGREIAKRLREIQNDSQQVHDLIERARESAWSELAREMDQRLAVVARMQQPDENYQAERESRLRDLITVDLMQLQMNAQQNSTSDTDETANDY